MATASIKLQVYEAPFKAANIIALVRLSAVDVLGAALFRPLMSIPVMTSGRRSPFVNLKAVHGSTK